MKVIYHRLIVVAAITAAASACGDRDTSEPSTIIGGEAASASGESGALASVDPTIAAAEPAAPTIEPLGNEPDVDLGPTLGGCSFTYNGEVMFIAGAPADDKARGKGVIQIGGVDRLLTGTRAGGPGMIDDGPTMTDGEYTVEVRRAEGDGTAVGVESARWPADLVVRKDPAGEKIYSPGTWTCGV